MTNPFEINSLELNENQAINRDDIIDLVLVAIQRNEYVSILAPIQTGKTFFLQQLDRTIKKNWNIPCYYIDLKNYPSNAQINFSQLYAQILGLSWDNQWDDLSLDLFLQKIPRQRIFLIDELTNDKELNISFLYQVRSYFNTVAGNSNRHIFVFANTIDLVDYTYQPNNPVSAFNIVMTFYLPDFSEDQVSSLIRLKSGDHFADNIIKQIYDVTFGHPFLVQYLCHYLYPLSEKETNDTLTDLDRLIEKSGMENTAPVRYLTSELFGNNTDDFRNILSLVSAIINEAKPVPYVISNPVIRQGLLLGCIRNDQNNCAIRNPIFQNIIARNLGLSAFTQGNVSSSVADLQPLVDPICRIISLSAQNYRLFANKSFERFHPQFNLAVGINASGKTSLLNLLAIFLNSCIEYLGYDSNDKFLIRDSDIRQTVTAHGDEIRLKIEETCSIEAQYETTNPNTQYPANSKWTIQHRYQRKEPSSPIPKKIPDDLSLPVYVFYRTERLWNPATDHRLTDEAMEILYQRCDGYSNWYNAHADDEDLQIWLRKQAIIDFQEGAKTLGWTALQMSLRQCFENFEELSFLAKEGQPILRFNGSSKTYNQLSDGERSLFALIADLVRRATLLNPHLGIQVLQETPGIVLIDELDLHLHPKWQRRIIENLRTAFPKFQFICTSHSPFLIQSLRSDDELILLDDSMIVDCELGHQGIEEIAKRLMGVDNPGVSARYKEMKDVAWNYLETLDEASMSPEEKLEAYKQRLADSIAPYAENPAFQAVLEMKRVAKLGE